MPKVVESKLVVKGDDQASSKLDKITAAIEKIGFASQQAAERLNQMMAAVGPAALPGGRAIGRGGVSAGRSPHAPATQAQAGVDAVKTGGYFRRGHATPTWSGRGGRAFGLGAVGGALGAGGVLLGHATQTLTPAVGGMLTTIGGAMTGMLGGLGGVGGLPLMAAGALMQLSSILAQPAIGHYTSYGDIYRRVGQTRMMGLRGAGARGGFNPEETARYVGQLSRMGATEGFGVMARMRFGGYAPEEMMGVMTAATRAGAAGQRRKQDYEFIGKVIAKTFAKESGFPSMAQAIDTMAGHMGTSEQYLSDLNKEQTKQLAVWTSWTEKSGSAMLKGDRGIKTGAAIWGAIATRGEPATEMLLWNIMGRGKGMTPYEFQKYRERGLTGGAAEEFLGTLAGMPRAIGAPLLSALTKGQLGYTQSEKMLDEYQRGGAERQKVVQQLKDAELAKTKIDYGIDIEKLSEKQKESLTRADRIQAEESSLKQQKLTISENDKILNSYYTFERDFTKVAAGIVSNGSLVEKALDKLAGSLNWFEKYLREGGRPGTGETAGPISDWLGQKLKDLGIASTRGAGAGAEAPWAGGFLFGKPGEGRPGQTNK